MITPTLGPGRRGANLLSMPRYIEQSHRLRPGDNLSVAEPSDDTGALHNLDVVSVDRRFNRPDYIRVVFANEYERRTESTSPCTELVNSIGGHAGASKIYFTWYRIAGIVSFDSCLRRIRFSS
jgi:hypothetical protein